MGYLREDLRRYFSEDTSLIRKLKIILLTQGIWALIIFRIGAFCYQHKKKNPYIKLFSPFLTFAQKIIEILTGIQIPFSAKIGKGFYIGHFGNIIIGSHVVIGEYCNISQGVTIGQAGRGGKQLSPVIGNRVYMGPGAKIFGGIKIEDNVAIGANAVVAKDLPENAVAVGVPAQIVSYNSSKDFIIIGDKKLC